uniref:Secreted protein n=1 Tax=Salix viminalis TaxID=40686 RepID=A0A6N2KTX1_SALVM
MTPLRACLVTQLALPDAAASTLIIACCTRSASSLVHAHNILAAGLKLLGGVFNVNDSLLSWIRLDKKEKRSFMVTRSESDKDRSVVHQTKLRRQVKVGDFHLKTSGNHKYNQLWAMSLRSPFQF